MCAQARSPPFLCLDDGALISSYCVIFAFVACSTSCAKNSARYFDGIRDLASCFMRCHCTFGFFAGIRDMTSPFTCRPCAGRHLLSLQQQRKRPSTASSCYCLRAPNRSYASYGNAPVCARCQRYEWVPHLLQSPVAQPTAAKRDCSPGGKLCVGHSAPHLGVLARSTDLAFQSGVVRISRKSLHTVCHLGGGGLSGTVCRDAGTRSG
ncbi:hypothetical protein SAMN04487926_101108 [Paraburkholderia steynii]|uniref:Uncharacterized protein n=1 Tax=Paraburkholderia steynii TaxID=1245441 RepID=A0A7Z7B2F2_9BURK|nr:hypothetical protein SAMN04487926_101108 [Paraburkholderia steynii]